MRQWVRQFSENYRQLPKSKEVELSLLMFKEMKPISKYLMIQVRRNQARN